MLGRRFSEVLDITNAGSQLATGNKVQIRIPRRSNLRLETILLHANVTVTATTKTAARNSLDGLFDEVRLKVSDYAGAGRYVVKAPSAAILNWAKDRVGRLDRFTQKAVGVSDGSTWPVTGTYDIIIPIHLFPQNINSVMANRFSIPMSDRIGDKMDVKGIDDDLILELDVHSAITNIGLSAGSCVFNYCKAQLNMREMAPNVPYVAQQLDYGLITAFTSTAETPIDIASGGFLLALGIDEFTSATARGDALDTTAASLGFWKLKYGRTDLQTWLSKQMLAWNEGYIQSYPDGTTGFTVDRNAKTFHVQDLLHDIQQGDAYSGASCLNLYTENKGDTVKLVATRPVSGSQIGLLTWKLFGPIEALNNA